MKLENLPIDQSVGAILVHNIVDTDGRKAFANGHVVAVKDVGELRALGKTTASRAARCGRRTRGRCGGAALMLVGGIWAAGVGHAEIDEGLGRILL